MKKGSVKSIRATLKNIADREKIDFQILIIRYLHERLLYRLANSEYVNNFILKGGLLLYAIEGLHIRPTMDIDMLARQISNNREIITQIFRAICNIKYEDDCVIFDTKSIEITDIAKDAKYHGVRILIDARLDTIRQRLQIDIGFGDVIIPAPVKIQYPVLLDELEKPQINAYSIETVIAEKFHAMIVLGSFNSRMKDFYDAYILLKNNEINNANLREAILQTFKNRETEFTDNPELFTTSFFEDKNRKIMWKAFLRKTKVSEELDFSSIVKNILERLQPIYYEQ